METLIKKDSAQLKRLDDQWRKERQRARGQTDTKGCPGVGGFSASLSEEMSSASPNRSSAAATVFAVEQFGRGTTLKYTSAITMPYPAAPNQIKRKI